MRNRPNNNWWFIKSNDGNCQGYWPGETKEEACLRFGYAVEQCSIKKVEWTDKGFVELDQSLQGKLL